MRDTLAQIGRRIAALRKAKHMTQAQLAERLNLAVETIGRMERGTATPSLAVLASLSSALDTELATLFSAGSPNSGRDLDISRLQIALGSASPQAIALLADLAERLNLMGQAGGR